MRSSRRYDRRRGRRSAGFASRP